MTLRCSHPSHVVFKNFFVGSFMFVDESFEAIVSLLQFGDARFQCFQPAVLAVMGSEEFTHGFVSGSNVIVHLAHLCVEFAVSNFKSALSVLEVFVNNTHNIIKSLNVGL